MAVGSGASPTILHACPGTTEYGVSSGYHPHWQACVLRILSTTFSLTTPRSRTREPLSKTLQCPSVVWAHKVHYKSHTNEQFTLKRSETECPNTGKADRSFSEPHLIFQGYLPTVSCSPEAGMHLGLGLAHFFKIPLYDRVSCQANMHRLGAEAQHPGHAPEGG